MCIIIVLKKGAKIRAKDIKNSIKNNNDGAGLMYFEKGKLVIKKIDKQKYSVIRHFIFKELYEAYNKADGDIVLHFRIATGSKTNLLNTQPFNFLDGGAVHNGILNYIESTPEKSDTRIYLEGLARGFFTEKGNENIIGKYNKFVFLFKDRTIIINEQYGIWNTNKNIWYSNSSYMYNNNLFNSMFK